MKSRLNNDRGIALIIVLWILVLLITLGAEFNLSMKTEVNTTRNFKEDIETYYLARAGINLAKAEIMGDAAFHSWTPELGFVFGKPVAQSTEEKDKNIGAKDEEALPEVEESPPREDLPLGLGTIQYSITDENGKLNINTATRETLSKALALNGMEFGSERDTIVDSILDWIDNDDKHRANGAESDYYSGLNPGYKAKNQPLDNLEELLRVRGMTPELLYGSEEFDAEAYRDKENRPGLVRIFTTANVTQFNPNTAEKIVLEVMFPEDVVKDILEKKEERGWYNFSKSTHFRIKATGKMDHSPTQHTIVAVFERTEQDKHIALRTRYWNDSYLTR